MNLETMKAMRAGFLATLVMTAIMYLAPMMGMPKMDIAAMLGSFVTKGPAPLWSGAWMFGMIIHFVNGTIIFPLIYSFALVDRIPGAPWLRGALWGVALWLIAQIVVMPVMGNGFFASLTPAPAMMVIGSLLGHLIYGSILGAGYGKKPVVPIKPEELDRVKTTEHVRTGM